MTLEAGQDKTFYSNINAPNNSIKEEHGFFDGGGKHLFYASFVPTGDIIAGVVLCSPIAEEKVRTIRVFVSFARALAFLGIAAITFDYYGDGDSEGEFEDGTFNDRINNIKDITRFFAEKYSINKMGMLGLRWGATLIAHLAKELSPNFLIMWEPIINTEKYLFDYLRLNIAAQMLVAGRVLKNREELAKGLESGETVSIEGYTISPEFYKSAKSLSLLGTKLDYSGKALLIQISPNPDKINNGFEAFSREIPNCKFIRIQKEFEWEKTETWQPAPPILFAETIKYLKENDIF